MTRKPNAQFRDSTATISWDVILLSTKLGHHVRAEAAVEAGAGAEASEVAEAVAAAVVAEAVAETAAIEEAVAVTVAGKRNSIEIEL
jgi:hypothetical protein